jgi:HSP20 family protein
MRRDDRDDPFDDIFREIERLMDEMISEGGDTTVDEEVGFGADTHVDVHETEETLRVVADLPGIEQHDLDLKCDGEVLTISAASEYREYDERISLPARVDEHTASATFKNGILEVSFDRTNGSASIDLG